MNKGFSREWPALLRAHGVIDGTSGILDSAGPGGTGKVISQMLDNMDVMARTSGIGHSASMSPRGLPAPAEQFAVRSTASTWAWRSMTATPSAFEG